MCLVGAALVGSQPSFALSTMFTFAAFCYMLSLVLCASLIFFAIWHPTVTGHPLWETVTKSTRKHGHTTTHQHLWMRAVVWCCEAVRRPDGGTRGGLGTVFYYQRVPSQRAVGQSGFRERSRCTDVKALLTGALPGER
ncbi:unnamed protein product [Arctogadus glacialis]